MDLVAACRVFVHVGERASFTDGAAAARVPQSVASRRVAALEAHLGRRLFDRTTRRTALTAFGRDLLPSAKRLVQLAEAFEDDAERALRRPLAVAVPELCPVRELAGLAAAARRGGAPALELTPAAPADRARLWLSRQVAATLDAVPPAEATWVVELGAAGELPAGAFRLEGLRAGRARAGRRRLWLQPEDDVPHVRDEVVRAGHRAGLAPAQVAAAASLPAAAAEAIGGDDLLLCSRSQAAALGLTWRAMAAPALARGYAVRAHAGEDAARLRDALHDEVARCLGADA